MHDLSAFDAAAIPIVLAAALGYFNHRAPRLPSTVGLTVMRSLAERVSALPPHPGREPAR